MLCASEKSCLQKQEIIQFLTTTDVRIHIFSGILWWGGVSGTPEGEWTFEIGPDYTSPQYISSEKLYVLCRDTKICFDLQMKRVRHTGIFFGEDERDQVRLAVMDFAPPGRAMAVRMIRMEDVSAKDRSLRLCADVSVWEGSAVTADLLLQETFAGWEAWFAKGRLPEISDRRAAAYMPGQRKRQKTDTGSMRDN